MGGYPMVGIGFRAQQSIHAIDLSANTCPWNPPRSLTTFHFKMLYLVYPEKEGVYLGTGVGILKDPETMRHSSGSFEGAIGYQWKNRVFLEGNAILPLKKSYIQGMSPVWPGLTLGFGF